MSPHYVVNAELVSRLKFSFPQKVDDFETSRLLRETCISDKKYHRNCLNRPSSALIHSANVEFQQTKQSLHCFNSCRP